MKKVYIIFIVICLNVLSADRIFASHAAGGELIYELVPNTSNQYKFTFKFYRDCSGVAEPSTFTMCYNNTCGVTNQSVTLSKIVGNLPNGQPNGSPIAQVGCYNQATICTGGVVAGYREWWYTGNVTLNSTCNFWRFWVALCCRNNAIGNVTTPGSQNIFVEANFDNNINLNSSPFVASPPIAYYCVNTPSFAYYTAIDPDGDSVSYESIAPQHNNTGCNNLAPVNIFSAPYTINEPFPTGNTFTVNAVTGVISFTPTTQGAWVFSVKIKEYRNGQYIGFVMRDIQFVVSVCNLPPPLSVFATYPPITCYGDLTTVTGVGNGGIPPYQYQLNGAGYQANNQFAGIAAGVYTITVMDANNCTNSTVFTINQPPPFVLFLYNIQNPICNAPCTGSAQSTVIGGVAGFSFSMTAPGVININTGDISALCAGAYTVTVTDANNCTATSAINIIQPVLGVTANAIANVSCNGACDGTAQANNVGGINPITYSITAPGIINPVSGAISGLCGGTYTVTATDAGSCTGTTVLTVTEPSLLSISVSSIQNETCNGACNGSSQSNASGGTLPYSYAISAPGIVTPAGYNSGLCAGTYTVTATDANGCTATTTFTVTPVQSLSVSINNISSVSCNGLCDGSSQTAASGGITPYTYSISPSGIANPATGANSSLCAGVFTVTVTDANGCTGTSSFSVTQPQALTVSINNIINVTCAGSCDGTAQANAAGGTSPYVFSINAPGIINANTGAASGLCAGTYTVTTTDASGCTNSNTFQIVQSPPLVWAMATATNVNCNGGADGTIITMATGGTGLINYNLQPNNINNAIGQFLNLTTGTYTVQATDANGCTITTTLSIAAPAILQITNIATTPPTCVPGNDGSATITASGGTAAYTYNIGGANQAGNVFNNLAAGSYTVTVTDANGCTATSVINIAQPLPPTITNVTATNITCNGANNGTITVIATGGLGPLNYNLQPGNINNVTGIFNNLAAGTYTITAGDANGCTVSTTATIIQPAILNWTLNNITNVNCNGGNNGAINVTATGGTGLINYNLQPNNVTNATGQFPNLSAGNYTIQATDANGCTISTIVNITAPSLLQITNITNTPLTCIPGNDGSITITASGGTVAYSYNIGGANQAGNVFNNLGSGSYTVTVIDANGCTATSTITIAPPNSPTITNIVTANVTCNGANNGSITASATGGIGALNYNLQPGNINNATGIFNNLSGGVYTITVGDANGCTVSSTITIIQPAILAWTLNNVTSVNCNGGNDGDITVSAGGGTGIINYTLMPNNITNVSGLFPNLVAGIYTMTAADANGCTLTTVIQVTQAPPLVWAITTTTNVSCNGGNDGTIITMATGGNGLINYTLQPNNINNVTGQFLNLTAGNYTIQATDANGCSISTFLSITAPAILQVANISNTQPTCVPGNDGSMTITAAGGTVAYSYNIGGANQAGNVFNNLASGNYTVTVTDANGCTATSTITIAPPNSPTITNMIATNVSCNGGSNGTITTSATGGIGALNYTLQPGNQNNLTGIFNNLAAGVYTVTVGDANGCTVSSTATVTQPTILSWSANTIVNVNCNGGSDGNITIVAAGGTGIINYTLQPNNITNASGLFPNLTAGNYTMTATDANGCTLTTTIQITQPPALTWTTTIATNVSCNGGADGAINTAATGGTGLINYNLQPNNITNASGQFANLTAGSYAIQATDANGCTISTVLNITAPTLLQITNITNTPPTCVPGNDGSMTITATGGTGVYTYNTGGANQAANVFNNLGSGNYTVTVTDANGCTATSTITIAPPNSPAITNIAVTPVICNGGSNGTITTSANGGIGALNYNLQPGNQNNANGIFANLAAGVYTITVGDANGCTVSSTATVTEPAILAWSANTVVNVNCNGGNDGDITIAAAGGTGIINYSLQPNNITNASGLFPNLTAGTYTMTATDANGCTLTTTIQITQAPALIWTATTVTNVNCNGGTDGAINTTATGGTGLINYNLQPNNITNASGQFTNLTAGAYTVVATDANGCTISTVLNITAPTLLQITNITSTQPTCVPGNDGSITVTATGGTITYSYNIGGANQAGNTFSNLGSGNYTVTVTDANGCTATSTITIAPPNSPTITSIAVTDVTCNGGSNGTITTSANGGIGALSYTLQPGNQNNLTGIFNNLAAGVYTITVGDANGCTVSSTATVTEPALLNWTLNNIVNVNCNGGNDGDITIAAAGGTGIINYNLQPNNITNASGLFPNLTAGTYTMTATDANGCTLTTAIQINQAPSLTWTVSTTTNVNCNGGADGAINTTATGGTGLINYNLQPNNITNASGQFANLNAGTYTVIATDANGCSISTILSITAPTVLQITNITSTQPSCVPGNDGSITVSVTGGTAPYIYNIGGANQPANIFNSLGSGNYTITVTDANGCTATSTIAIAPPNSPGITSVTATDVSCNGGNNGSITISANGGIGALNYNLQPGNQNNAIGTFNNLTAGVYTITVGDANGCTVSSTATLAQPPVISWTTVNVINVNCNGGNDGSISTTAVGGTGVINYTLQPNNITNASGIFPNLTAGSYTVTAMDANNCTLTIPLLVTQSPALTWTTTTATNVSCNGGTDGSITTTATGGTGLINYTLQPNNINNANGLFANLNAGAYTIQATDVNGCSITTILNISQPAVLQVTNIAVAQPSCVPGNDGGITITATGGTIAYSYNIGGANQAANVFNNLGAGIYTVTVTDANGCTATSTVNVAPPNSPIITSAVTTLADCNPGNNGTVTITATGGTGVYNYSANGINFQLNNTITGLAAGTYTITVQDALGCTSTSAIVINTTPSPVITSIIVTDASCIPGCDATATITATGGNAVYNYSIDNINFQASNLFANICVNIYTATVVDGNGCTATSTFTISSANGPTITLNSTVDILCFGGNNGAISVSAVGAGAINYLLLPTGINNLSGLFTNLTANTYTVQATDASGCSVATTIIIAEPPLLQITNILNNGALCSGGNNGNIDITTAGGTGVITFAINPFANFVPPATFNNLVGNTTYTITATDANGCSTTSSVFVAEPQPVLWTTAISTDISCFNGSNGAIFVQAIGGTGILNYSIVPNAQNNVTGIFNNLTANTYTVTVTDANNCSISTMLTLSQPAEIIVSALTSTDVTCSNLNDGSINISCTGGTGVLTYNLQPVNITNFTGVFNNLGGNIYSITVTDANGCTFTTTVAIVNPQPLVINTLTASNVLCHGDSNGNILINVTGGTGILNYNILPQNVNNVTGIFSNLAAGTYTITIADANLCSISTSVLITEPLVLSASVLNIQNILCSGVNSGQIDIGANGGTIPYTFTLLPLNISNGNGIFANLLAGSYTVNVVDANQCSVAVQPIVITEPPAIKFESLVKEDVKCFGDATGVITVTASGGTGNLVFSIMPNIGQQAPAGNFSSLTAGTYTITATDANNCTLTTTATILQNPEIIISQVSLVTPKCWGDITGIIHIIAAGGIGQLTYTLNNQNPNTTGFFNQLPAGSYLATITDSLGCKKDSLIILTQPDKVSLSALEISPVYCSGSSDGKIQATATGGNGGYTYYLRPGLNVNKFGYFENLHEGSYSLTVKDSLGCLFDTVIAITPAAPMKIVISKKDLGCYGTGFEGWAQANVFGGNEPFAYLWNSSPAQFDAKAVNLKYGKYIVEVTDAKGCKGSDSIVIDPGPCCEEVFIPNAFSPNGDGNNDVFRVTTATGIELIQFEIYDRWGQKVWLTDDFREGWDGNQGGQPRDMTTYYYIFRYRCLYDGENYMRKGDVNLIR